MSTETKAAAAGPKLAHVSLLDIEVSETNKMFREDAELQEAALKELITSINEKGVIQPVLLRPGKKGNAVYELVAGERRFRASKFADKESIPAYIRELTDEDALECQITENLQRDNVNPMKEATAFEWMIKTKKLTTEAIARKLGKSMDYVQSRLRLTTLIKPIQDLIRSGEIPLKAGLKYAMIPEKQQKDALDSTTEKLVLQHTEGNGANKTRTVFSGLEKLQDWMDEELWTNLAHADFDLQDPKLNPEMGACGGCPFRTKNTGGLFDDITSEDKCLQSTCFRTKQVNNYKQEKERLEKKYPGKTVIFKKRGYALSSEEFFKKQLGEIKSENGGQLISEKEMISNKKGEIAILVGHPRYGNIKDMDKKIVFVKPAERPSSGGERISTAKPLTKEQKEKQKQLGDDKQLRDNKQSVTEALLTAELLVKAMVKKREDFLRAIIVSLADTGDAEDFRVIFVALGLDWTEEFNGKRTGVKAKEADLAVMFGYDSKWDIGLSDIEDAIAKCKLDQLITIAVVAQFLSDYQTRQSMKKDLKIDDKVIKMKATTITATWWNELKAKRAKEEEYKKNPDLKKVDAFIALPIGKKKGGKKK